MSRPPTRRELQVFEAVCRSGSAKAAAHELGITPWGVRDTLARLYRVIGAHGMAHAAWLLWGPGATPESEHLYKTTGQDVLTGA